MKIFSLVMSPVLMTTLLAGCMMEPGEEPVGKEDQIAGVDAARTQGSELGVRAAAAEVAPAVALDGRAAVAAEAKALGAINTVSPSLTSTWYSGSMAPGATQHWFWNNASLTAAYKVGLSPVGASTTSACGIEVTRSLDIQKNGGEREFHFYITNTGTITCGANILLDAKQRFTSFATGGIEAGASKSFTWNNANPLNAAHLVGVSPSGATSLNPCELEVVRSYYAQQPSGEREFRFTIKNAGEIACQGEVELALTTSAVSSWVTGTLSPGASKSWFWNNANPLDRVFLPGLSPTGASGSSVCQLEVEQTYYRQVINSDGSAERKFFLSVKNPGSLSCGGTLLLNSLD